MPPANVTCMHSAQDQGVVLSIQHLRCVAAMLVVWHHATGQIAAIDTDFGANGVDLFFVISGFVMVATTAGRHTRPATFMKRRLLRVVPLYWMLTAAMVWVALMVPGTFSSLVIESDTFFKSLLFIPHFSASFPDRVLPLLAPGWTLNLEMYFYLVFGLSLMLPEAHRLPALALFFVASAAMGWVFGPFATAIGQTYTSPMLLEFVAGALTARAWLSGRLNVSTRLSAAAVVLGFVSLLFVDMGVEGLGPLVGASLVVIGALNKTLAGWRHGLLQRLGDASYSIYLTHLFTLGALRVTWNQLVPAGPSLIVDWLFLGLALVACAAVGYASYLCLERPLLAKLAAGRRIERPARSAGFEDRSGRITSRCPRGP
jgi:exopolysaccharide production protein ExoZ